MEFVAVVVGGDDVKEEDVLSFLVQPAQSELHLRKHLPGRERLWLGSSLVTGS